MLSASIRFQISIAQIPTARAASEQHPWRERWTETRRISLLAGRPRFHSRRLRLRPMVIQAQAWRANFDKQTVETTQRVVIHFLDDLILSP